MSAIDEGIVREYFEQNGFLVRQVRKYQVQARRKTGDEDHEDPEAPTLPEEAQQQFLDPEFQAALQALRRRAGEPRQRRHGWPHRQSGGNYLK